MKKLLWLAPIILLAANDGSCSEQSTDQASERQTAATRTAMDGADREVGMPRIVNFAQRKLLKNAYEDMDTTTLTYVYVQSQMDGKFLCLGQSVGYGVSLGTQFTAPTAPDLLGVSERGIYARPQPEPNGLYSADSGAATIVNLINPANGEAHTALIEPNVITTPIKLPDGIVSAPCPGDVDPQKVKDAKEVSVLKQRG